MNKLINILIVTCIWCWQACAPKMEQAGREREFDLGWKFLKDSIDGPQEPGYDDADWRTVDLPHDWSMEDLSGQNDSTIIGPFNKSSIGATATGYVIGGTAWYRKHFTLAASDTGKVFILQFDGVYNESDVWVNGHHVGYHAYGYTPFGYDISKWMAPAGADNVIAVRVKNLGKNSRWYSGSGIYRHVTLSVLNPVHIPVWGVAVTTPSISSDKAIVRVAYSVANHSKAKKKLSVRLSLTGPDGIKMASLDRELMVDAGLVANDIGELSVTPYLWSPENPAICEALIEIYEDDRLTDTYRQPFGIREVTITTSEGLKINGKPYLLKGACMHHDNGLLGAAAFDRAEERRVEIMKANGFNAIRTSHNPPSRQFLDACDRLGMLVIDEAFDMWERPKNPQDYSVHFRRHWRQDLEAMVLRDRNHPSVIMWSIGNEINERADTSGVRIAAQLREAVLAIDSTRPVTAAICGFWDHPGRTWEQTEPAFTHLDIGGYNYQWQQYQPDHQKFPQRIMYGSESVPKEAWQNWYQVLNHSWVIGDFVWTGMDYLGETGIGHIYYEGSQDYLLQTFPWVNAWCGDIDICGDKKPQMYFRDVVWDNSVVELAVHKPLAKDKVEKVSYWGWPDEQQSWNWPGHEADTLDVNVYTKAKQVRLELNGKVIGEKTLTDSSLLTARFRVPYIAGNLKAIALDGDKVLGSRELTTTGPAVTIRLTPERTSIKASRNDLAYIKVEAVDQHGRLVTDANLSVTTEVAGAGEWLASGSASPTDIKSFRKKTFILLNGRGLIIARPYNREGKITVKALSDGLQPGECKIIVGRL